MNKAEISVIRLQDDLSRSTERVSVVTRYGPVTGGRASNGAAVFLGMLSGMSR